MRQKLPSDRPSLLAEAMELAALQSEEGELFKTPLFPPPPVEPDKLPAGTILRERYAIQRHLGSGGMCEVYLADDAEAGEQVAIKLLNEGLSADPYLVALLRRELRIGRSIQHPNVCRTYGIDDALLPDGEKARFIVMEYLEGETLAKRISRGPLDEEEAEGILQKILDGLEAAHQLNILHGDLKCSNIIMARRAGEASPVPVITDFGLARRLGPSQQQSTALSGKIMGTALYMPPEQFQGGVLTAAADFYSAGVILFHMLSGRYPFEGQTWQETARMRTTQAAPSLRTLRPQTSRRLSRFIEVALSGAADERPQSVTEMRQALRRSWVPNPGRLLRKRRGLLSGALLGVMSLSGGIWWWASPRQGTTENPQLEQHIKLGSEFAARRTREGFQEALREYKIATKIDPKSTKAWVGLAETYGGMSNWGVMAPSEALQLGRQAAQQALDIDRNSVRANGILGYLTSIDVKNWQTAEPHFQQALGLAPNDPKVRFWYATHLGRLGRHGEAIEQLKFAHQADPQLLVVGHQLAFEYQRSGDYKAFLEQARDLVRIQPFDGLAHLTLCRALSDNGMQEEAEAALAEAERFRAGKVQLLFARAHIAVARKRLAEARRYALELDQLAKAGPIDSSIVACAFALVGDLPSAIGHLEKGLHRGDSTVLLAHVQSAFRPYRQHPDFVAFVRSTGLGSR